MSTIGVIRKHGLTPENMVLLKINNSTKTQTCELCLCRCKSYANGFSFFGCCKSCFRGLKEEIVLTAKRDAMK